jgi:hypothetical protein
LEERMIADNEFSEQFTADMPSADTMQHNVIKYYNLTICECGKEFYQRKDGEQRDKCGLCIRKGER